MTHCQTQSKSQFKPTRMLVLSLLGGGVNFNLKDKSMLMSDFSELKKKNNEQLQERKSE